MATNWIKYPIDQTPDILTSEDLHIVSDSKVQEFFGSVKHLFIIRASGVLEELGAQIEPANLCALLESSLLQGFMDTGWTEDYIHAVQQVSERMGGYPKAFRAQWRKFRQAMANPGSMASSAAASYEASSNIGKPPPTEPAPANSRRLNFYDLPEKVRTRIYDLLFFRGEISIGDWDWDVKPKGFSKRTEYRLFDPRTRRRRNTSYTVRDLANIEPFHFNIMLGNKQLATEIAEVFYSKNTFKFLGTAESALAFFHDRAPRLDLIRRVAMQFSTSQNPRFQGCYNGTCAIPRANLTYIRIWRFICNLFVHSSMGLEDFQLILDASFWQSVPQWTMGAQDVLNIPHLCENRDGSTADGYQNEPRTFLEHVARLSGVNITLMIEGGWHNAQQENFRRALEHELQQRAFHRPQLTDDAVPRCTCNRRLLSECCFINKWATYRDR